MFEAFYLTFLLIMFIQGIISIYFSIYIWEDPERMEEVKSPDSYVDPEKTFSLLLPAREEEQVIAETIAATAAINYPKHKYEIIVICEASDTATIAKAQEAINQLHLSNARVLTFDDLPVNKPHALNTGLAVAAHEIIAIIDAEDEVHPDILNITNTIFVQQQPDIIQAGVQLMDYDSHWFSVHNVLEYFFWFKSRMHLHAKLGMVPLGGNTVFFQKTQLEAVGGWDEDCLTEDAEVGIRLTAAGANCIATYDARHVTKEETPESVWQFIKQRTRWNQGFLQVLAKGSWLQYNTWFKKVLCVYTLAFPLIQSVLLLVTPIIFIAGLYLQPNIALSLFSMVPVLLLGANYLIGVIALREFIKDQQLPTHLWAFPSMLLTLLPYQFLLGVSAVRATYRELRGINNWEKTRHLGTHRQNLSVTGEPAYS